MAKLTGEILRQIFARNIELLAFKRGLKRADLAQRIGVSSYVLNRILECRNRHLDPEIVAELLKLFACTPNDLFLPHSDVNYPRSGDSLP